MESRRSDKRFYFGVVLIFLGAVMILERLELIPESVSDILISWQMLLIGIGVLSILGGNRVAGTILVVIGGTFLVPELIVIPEKKMEVLKRIYFPMVLVGIGAALLIRQHDRRSFKLGQTPPKNHSENGSSDPSYSSNSTESMNSFDDFVIFGGREIFINSQALAGGKATSIFGGIEFDLRKANLQPGGAVIDCVSVFGGCGFKIPMDWNVRNEVTTIFGAFTDKRGETYSDRYYDPSKTIVIKGVSIFGGVEVKHF